MQIRYLATLQTQRDLYELPRGSERFQKYIDIMTVEGREIGLPLAYLNPMAKEHAAARLDALLAQGADAIGAAAAAEASLRLADVPGSLALALVLVDDVGGGWTQPYLTDARHRFDNEGEVKRGFATGFLWTSGEPSDHDIHTEALLGLYRAAYQQRHGQPKTLQQMLRQEGLAGAFARAVPAARSADRIRARGVIDSLRSTDKYPVAFACLYGDEAARSAGYPPLGVAAWAGFGVATAETLEAGDDPVEALLEGE